MTAGSVLLHMRCYLCVRFLRAVHLSVHPFVQSAACVISTQGPITRLTPNMFNTPFKLTLSVNDWCTAFLMPSQPLPEACELAHIL